MFGSLRIYVRILKVKIVGWVSQVGQVGRSGIVWFGLEGTESQTINIETIIR